MQFEGGALWVLGFMCVQLKFLNDEIRKESSETKSNFQSFTIDMCSFKLSIYCYYIALTLQLSFCSHSKNKWQEQVATCQLYDLGFMCFLFLLCILSCVCWHVFNVFFCDFFIVFQCVFWDHKMIDMNH
jgi:hypothetical protein